MKTEKKQIIYKTVMLLSLSLFCFNAYATDSVRLTLPKVIEIALDESSVVKISDEEIALKKEVSRDVLSALFPEVSMVGNYSRAIEKQTMALNLSGETSNIAVGADNSYSAGINATVPIINPVLYQNMKITKIEVEFAIAQSRESKLNLIEQVSKAYYQLLLCQDTYSVIDRSYKQSEENFRVVNDKFINGTVSKYDKITAEVQMQSIKPNLISAKNACKLAHLQLKVLMGIDIKTEFTVEGQLKDYEKDMYISKNYADHLLLDDNATIEQLQIQEEMLLQNYKKNKAAFLPTLSASFNYAYTSLNNDFKFSSYNWNPYSTVGVTLKVPLFKYSNNSKVKQSKIKMQQFEYSKKDVENRLWQELEIYRDRIETATEQIASSKYAIEQAIIGREIAKKRYEIGKGTVLELNNSEVLLMQIELSYNHSFFDYMCAKADLDNLLGRNNYIN